MNIQTQAQNNIKTKLGRESIPLWQQLQSTSAVLMAVRAGESGTTALKAVAPYLRPGVQSLSFHVWRWLGTAQILKAMLAKRAPPPQVDALLCVALTLLCYDAPIFAEQDEGVIGENTRQLYDAFTVVDQTVEAAKRYADTRASSSFINACLRGFLREKSAMTMAAATHLVGRWNHPEWWIKRVKADHPIDWQSILASNNARAPLTLRVNARKSTVAVYLKALNAIEIEANQVGEYGVILSKPTPVADMLGFAEGMVSVQDAAAQLAAPLLLRGLKVHENLQVLDACAAPGGKTAHLLELMDGEVTALDIDPARCEKINETLNRLGLKAQILVADAAQPESWVGDAHDKMFDAILLDAPCTASGIVRRHPDIRWLRRESDVEKLAAIQRNLLQVLWRRLKPGGRLLYCTCSVFKEEGQEQIDRFMASHRDVVLLPSPGHLISKKSTDKTVVTDNAPCNHDGFFYALLEKQT